MPANDLNSRMAGPLPWIGVLALIVGGVSFTGGFFGPMFLSPSNLGPILGIFVTGPVGALVGALVGCGIWAKRAGGPRVAAVWKWIAGIWLISLFYTAFMERFGPWWTSYSIAVQVVVFGEITFLLYHRGIRSWHPRGVRACGPVVLAVVGLIALMSLFPPVTRPWWGPVSAQPAPQTAESLPSIAFMFHSGFDASRHIPQFAVNLPVLVLEWAATAAAGLIACILIARRVRSGGPPGPFGEA